MRKMEDDHMRGYLGNGDEFSSYFDMPSCDAHYVCKGGKLLAFIISEVKARHTKVHELHVLDSPNTRRKGIGTKLLNAACGSAAIELEVHEQNGPARTFYEKNGFIEHSPWDGDVLLCKRAAIQLGTD
mgnify:CR=1 FL=1